MVSFDTLPVIDPSEKKITIDFSDSRRKSFLPDSFAEDKHGKKVQVHGGSDDEENDDDFFVFMRGNTRDYEKRPMKKFCTGSKYLGQWNKLGIAGKGIYKYPHGVIYDGYFNRKGEFHGNGVLVYPNGERIEGIWQNGLLNEDCNFITKGGVFMNKNYCQMPDRRFQIEVENDFNPVGQEFLTNEVPPPRFIPVDCYDVVEGYFDPGVKTVYEYPKDLKATRSQLNMEEIMKEKKHAAEDNSAAFNQLSLKSQSEVALGKLMMMKLKEEHRVVSWIPSIAQEGWIVRNCRKEWDEATGYRPELYETWTKGGEVHTGKPEDESAVEFISNLDTLQLSPKVKKGEHKLISFVRNRRDQQDVKLEMLTKMFLNKGSMSMPRQSNTSAKVRKSKDPSIIS